MHAQAGLVSSLSVSRPHKLKIIMIVEAIRSGDLSIVVVAVIIYCATDKSQIASSVGT